MRALVCHEPAGPDALRLEERDEPAAQDGLVLIDVHAAGVGFVDLLVTRGQYQIRPDPPFVPGIEVAGVRRDTGERVCATTLFGGFAEVAAAPELLAFPIPDAMPFDVAAALVVNYQTAHLALTRRGRLKPGETVLVHGAAGGVGTASIQVAKALDAGAVIGVARGEEKARAAREAGADHVVEADGDWVAAVRELGGADVVVDPVGGDRFDHSLRCMKAEGRLLVVGFAEGRIPTLPVNRLLLRHLDVVGVNFGGLVPLDQEFPRAAAADLLRWWEEGTVRPVVGERYPLADGAHCLRDFAERRVVGKPVLLVRS
ncbi:MAG TPA: NADPH:quinone oxidoreductase family protein [Solirubrobacteraceae bacterium]|nr:NADPH:quinone oxidoreductase family protein [Solirubrobacteraceae bacterium]